jgi:hypothetical protein
MKKQIIVYSVIVSMLAGIIIVYSCIFRPWQLTWGATPREAASVMPGDEFLDSVNFNATRAITINAEPEKIWPWLVQMGDMHGGWYNFDFLDKKGKPGAERLIPNYKRLVLGDKLAKGFWVKDFRKGKWILLEGKGEMGRMTWLMMLDSAGQNNTRFITRLRVQWYNTKLPYRLSHMVFDLGEVIVMRKSMQGIKECSESPNSNLAETKPGNILMTKLLK